jgi:hypothetical protein
MDKLSLQDLSRQALIVGTTRFTDPTGNIGYSNESLQVSALVRIAEALEAKPQRVAREVVLTLSSRQADAIREAILYHNNGFKDDPDFQIEVVHRNDRDYFVYFTVKLGAAIDETQLFELGWKAMALVQPPRLPAAIGLSEEEAEDFYQHGHPLDGTFSVEGEDDGS